MLRVEGQLAVPLRELGFRYSTSSGPGGQNVNRRRTKATLLWNLDANRSLPAAMRTRFRARFAHRINADGDVVVTSQRFRDRGRNSADCVEKLRGMLLEVARPPRRRRATRPTRSSVERRLREKQQRARQKHQRRAPGADE